MKKLPAWKSKFVGGGVPLGTESRIRILPLPHHLQPSSSPTLPDPDTTPPSPGAIMATLSAADMAVFISLLEDECKIQNPPEITTIEEFDALVPQPLKNQIPHPPPAPILVMTPAPPPPPDLSGMITVQSIHFWLIFLSCPPWASMFIILSLLRGVAYLFLGSRVYSFHVYAVRALSEKLTLCLDPEVFKADCKERRAICRARTLQHSEAPLYAEAKLESAYIDWYDIPNTGWACRIPGCKKYGKSHSGPSDLLKHFNSKVHAVSTYPSSPPIYLFPLIHCINANVNELEARPEPAPPPNRPHYPLHIYVRRAAPRHP